MDSEPHQTFKIESFSKIAQGSKRRINDSATSKLSLPAVLDKGIQLLTNGTKNSTPVVAGVLGPPP